MLLTTTTVDDHNNQNKNGHKTTATTMLIPSLGSNINVINSYMEKDDKITTSSIEIRRIIFSSILLVTNATQQK